VGILADDACTEDATIGQMIERLKAQKEKGESRGDYWDEETGLYVCGRCGRQWDGNICVYPRNRSIIHSSFTTGNAQCFECVECV
jgi:hypothetical protein